MCVCVCVRARVCIFRGNERNILTKEVNWIVTSDSKAPSFHKKNTNHRENIGCILVTDTFQPFPSLLSENLWKILYIILIIKIILDNLVSYSALIRIIWRFTSLLYPVDMYYLRYCSVIQHAYSYILSLLATPLQLALHFFSINTTTVMHLSIHVWEGMKTIRGCNEKIGSTVDGDVVRAKQFNHIFNRLESPAAPPAAPPAATCPVLLPSPPSSATDLPLLWAAIIDKAIPHISGRNRTLNKLLDIMDKTPLPCTAHWPGWGAHSDCCVSPVLQTGWGGL